MKIIPQFHYRSLAPLFLAGLVVSGSRLPAQSVVSVNSVADLRSMVPGSGAPTVVELKGYWAGSPKGAGSFVWEAGSATPDDGGTILGSSSAGRWKRVYDGGAVEPEWFGAKHDGSDDRAALQTALSNALVIRGKPGVVYSVSDTLYMQQNKPMIFLGNGATLRITSGTTQPILRVKNEAHRVEGWKIDGNSLPGRRGVIVEGTAAGSILEKNEIFDVAASAIITSEAHWVRIVGNRIDNCGFDLNVAPPHDSSILVGDTNEAVVEGNVLTNCSWGIYFRGSQKGQGKNLNYKCVNNTVYANTNDPREGRQGISQQYAVGSLVAGNRVRGFSDNGIDSFGGEDLVISANIVSECKDGIFVGHSETRNVSVTGNVTRKCQTGIRIWDGANSIVVSGNSIRDCLRAGIWCGRSPEHTTTVQRISIAQNVIDQSNPLPPPPGHPNYTPKGIWLATALGVQCHGNIVFKARQEGIFLEQAELAHLGGNFIQDASSGSPQVFDGIRAAGSGNHRLRIFDNTLYGGAGNAVKLEGGSNHYLSRNRWRSIPNGIVNAGSGTVNDGSNTSF